MWLCAAVLCVFGTVLKAQPTDEADTGTVAWKRRLHLLRILEAPSIHVYAGVGRLGREGLEQAVRDPGVIVVEIGSAELKPRVQRAGVLEYERDYLVLGVGSSGLGVRQHDEGLAYRWWRFGLGQEEGYGYRVGEQSALLLTHGGGMRWTVMAFPDTVVAGVAPFHKRLRFGVARDGALIVQVSPVVGVGLSFERSVVFPAHLVWKHLGSSLIEGVGHVVIEQFVQRVLRARTPAAAPVVSFVLHNGFAIGWYELLRNRMNWPFASAPPLTMDVLRLHVQWLF